jgi:tetratricopeptide (TPR) repeat protein
MREEAEAALEKTLAAGPGQADAAEAFAALREEAGRPAEALEILEHARERGAVGLGLLERLSRLYLDAGRDEDAARTLREVVDQDKERTSAWSLLGLALARRPGSEADAVEALNEALRRQPDDATAWCALGLCRRRQRDSSAAVRAFGEALESSVRWVRERYAQLAASAGPSDAGGEDLARAFLDHGLLAEAGQVVEDLLRTGSGRAEAHYLDGKIKLELGRYRDAEMSFRRSLDFDRARAETWLELAALYAQQGRWRSAVETLREFTARFPDVPSGHVNLGVALLEGGRRDEALASLKRAIERDPRHGEAHLWLGRVHLAAGDRAAALEQHRELRAVSRALARQLFFEIHR